VVSVEDPEVGVLGDDRDDFSGVTGADAQALPGDHDHAVARDAPFGSGRWWEHAGNPRALGR
jgi:hypothetical protein